MSNYIQRSTDLLLSKDYINLRDSSKFILELMMLESKWNNACFEFPFKKTAKLTGMSMNTINSAISELVNKNFIARHTTGSFGKFPSLYKICVDKKLWKVKISPVVSIL